MSKTQDDSAVDLFNRAPVSLCRTLRDGKIVLANARAVELLGFDTLEQLLRTNIAECFVDPQQRLRLLSKVEEQGVVRSAELQVKRRDRTTVWVLCSVRVARDDNGATRYFDECFIDISQRTRTEAELSELTRPQPQDEQEEQSSYMASMSHELRTPVNSIIGMIGLVLDTELTREQREYLEIAVTSARFLMNLVNSLIDVSKGETGQLEMDSISFSPRDCVASVVALAKPRAQEKQLSLNSEVAPDVPDEVRGDPGRLRQILVNLVGNAIKFTHEGSISITTRVLDSDTEGITLEVAVADTGIGIPEERLATLFTPFAHGDDLSGKVFGGIGLGLTISHRLAEAMQGKLSVQSQPGAGSRFALTARFVWPSADRTALVTPVGLDQLQGLPVLLADSDELTRRQVAEMLRSWGVQPLEVDSSDAALAVLAEQAKKHSSVQLALVSSELRELNGFELVERVQADVELEATTFFMLSPNAQQGDAARCRQLGIIGYLTQPCTPPELLAALRTAVATQRSDAAASLPLITRHSLREARSELRILLAEDDRTCQAVASTLLRKRGYEVAIAKTGAEALTLLEQESYDLLLLDVQLPQGDGLEVTEKVRRHEQGTGHHLPIIAFTAHALQGHRERFLEAGMDGYVAKPFTPDELYAALDRVLDPAGNSGAEQEQ